ncbi:hypothetical protein [Lactiplantibacillus plantarum]|uniref:hypothetical protein n=1 Tax=Lactiplantibacillus plantarum TaxID=1590 RepID=UPI00293C3C0F|nr:hypothetical protein [Lactiplantibacillus plantarum]MDV3525965.1 hypothetical protein [Lactiplantibacillus plantarum]
MSKSEVIQNLLDELNNQNQIYIAIIGIILTVIGLGFTLFSFMQLRFSDKQIKKMEDDFKKDFKQDFKIEENNEVLKDMKATLVEVRKNEKLLKEEISTATDLNFECQWRCKNVGLWRLENVGFRRSIGTLQTV